MFLADENFPRAAIALLRENGFATASIAERTPGSTDERIIRICGDENLTLLTLDKDFGELVFRKGQPAKHGVILFRVDTENAAEFARLALAALRSRTEWIGVFAVVSNDRIRIRSL